LKQCGRKGQTISLKELYPKASADALDLMSHLLDYDRYARFTAVDALEHKFLASFHNPEEEPVCEIPFDFNFEFYSQKYDFTYSLCDEIKSFRDEVRSKNLRGIPSLAAKSSTNLYQNPRNNESKTRHAKHDYHEAVQLGMNNLSLS
jgi:serine/threonine protein kinase